MKILKRILIVLAVVLLVISAVALLFFPSQVHMERSVVIDRKQEMVFNYVNNLKNWNSWSPFFELDTTVQCNYEGPESGTGATIKWVSRNEDVGSGSMIFTKSVSPTLIKEDLNLMERGSAKVDYRFEPDGNNTKVTWSINVEMGANPVMRIMGAFLDKMLGKTYEKGLAKLKMILEAMPEVSYSIKIEMTTVKSTLYMAVHDTATAPTISQKLGMGYGMIGRVMKKQKLNMAGAPFAIYHSGGPGQVFDMEAAIPVDKPGIADGKVIPGEIKEGNVVMARYFGDYMKISMTYEALHEYMKNNNKKITGSPWESYVTDPGTEKDTAKWETDVYYPVE